MNSSEKQPEKNSMKNSQKNSQKNSLRSDVMQFNLESNARETKPDVMLQLLIRNYQKAADELSKYLQYTNS